MKQIKLTQNKFAIVDDWNFDWLNQWMWQANCRHGVWYAQRGDYTNGKRRIIQMHREILGLYFGDKKYSDHINHNGLDNRESNLRVVTYQQNQFNRKNVKGCYWNRNGWQAQIRFNGKIYYLGRFDNKKEAHEMYLKAKKIYHKFVEEK